MSDDNAAETVVNQDAPQAHLSVRDALNSAVDAIEKPESVTIKDEAPAEGGGRSRDDQGRFVPKVGDLAKAAKAEDGKEKTAPAAAPVVPPAEGTPEKPAVAVQAVEPPQHWSQADKDKFKSAPPELQSWLMDRHKAMEGDYTRRVQQVQQIQKDYGPIDELFKPFEQQLTASGHTKTSIIKAWANVEQKLISGQAPEVVANIIRGYKVDINALNAILEGKAPPQGQQAAPPPVDPEKLKTDLTAHVMTEIQKDRAQQSMVSAIETFSLETEAGKPAHPFFNDVVEDMIVLAQAQRAAGRTPVLKDLYDQACWANSSTREKLLALRTPQPAPATKVDQAKAKAATARKAGSSVTGAPGGGAAPPKIPTGSVRETLQAVAANFEA